MSFYNISNMISPGQIVGSDDATIPNSNYQLIDTTAMGGFNNGGLIDNGGQPLHLTAGAQADAFTIGTIYGTHYGH